VAAAIAIAAAAAATAVALAVGSGAGGGTGAADQPSTSLATVTRRSLSAQTQADGTLGYTDSSTVVLPAGTAPSALRQAQQAAATALAQLRTAESTFANDRDTLEQARAKLTADRQSLVGACAGDNAATAASASQGSNAQSSDTGSCSTLAAAVASDQTAATAAQAKVTGDASTLDSARTSAATARQSLDAATASAVFYEAGATYTGVPSVGDVVRRGRPLVSVGGRPVLLLYGNTTAWRVFRIGMSPGRDVAALNANLRALGFGRGLSGNRFTPATAAAIRALQAAHGLQPTGELPLGSVVFASGPVRVKGVPAARGAAVQAGPVLSVTSLRHQVTVALDATQQAAVKRGDSVTITLPDTRTTRGVVAKVGSVATGGGQDSSPTVEVDVRLLDERDAGHLDGAPVQVAITTDTARNALTAPVAALLALAGGGYAIEVVDDAGVHRLVAVTLGLFDDADGLVQITGPDVRAGQRVVVPGS